MNTALLFTLLPFQKRGEIFVANFFGGTKKKGAMTEPFFT
jgi:hypothetical protein